MIHASIVRSYMACMELYEVYGAVRSVWSYMERLIKVERDSCNYPRIKLNLPLLPDRRGEELSPLRSGKYLSAWS